ncbi:hypothetical protein P7K49_015628 [Saguinus oedipus]|uniref:Uncharacterized protein n=1 Tax=Saguinus oedipus TaxID=9490 RepID=A0ABQ9V9R8_SAGOE|nr:hypothetical protein P7K49_015628 [Saguinus oedipus]
MDAMGLSNKKPNTVSTSHSGSFAPNNPDLAKAAGIVSPEAASVSHNLLNIYYLFAGDWAAVWVSRSTYCVSGCGHPLCVRPWAAVWTCTL